MAPRTAMLGAVALVVAMAVVGGIVWAVSRSGSSSTGASSGLNGSGSGSGGSSHESTTTTLPPTVPLTVQAISPAASATNVATNATIQVTFSQTLAPGAPDPEITPAVAGTWAQQGATMTFTPTGGFLPYTSYHVTIPSTITTTEQGRSVALAAAVSSSFTVQAGSVMRLQELLAELNYLPVTFVPAPAPPATTVPPTTTPAATAAGGAATTPTTPTTTPPAAPPTTAPATPLAAEATTADAVVTGPLNGGFAWRFPNTPASLAALWTAGQSNVITKGAIMAFQSDHNLTMDGVAGPSVWNALVQAVAARQATSRPYDYLYVTESTPEKLTVWQNGSNVYSTLANTGVAGATTQLGTFPVYERFQTTTMTGTNPDGSKYSDPGVPWVAYFNGGDAVHGFPRSSYGWPQSDGCVELPISNAQTVWGMDPLGTLVTVAA